MPSANGYYVGFFEINCSGKLFAMHTVNNGRSSKTVCMLSSVHAPLDIRIYHKECKTLAGAGYEVTLIVPSREMVNSDGIRIFPIPPERNRLLRMTRSVWRIY